MASTVRLLGSGWQMIRTAAVMEVEMIAFSMRLHPVRSTWHADPFSR